MKVTHVLVDDLTGEDITDGGETIIFGLDGVAYEIDLNDGNAEALRADFAPYIAAARKRTRSTSGDRRHGHSAGASRAWPGLPPASAPVEDFVPRRRDSKAIRAWARAQGYGVPAFGRLPNEIVRAYRQAHPE